MPAKRRRKCLPVVGYIRTENENDSLSQQAQQALITTYADLHHLDVVKVCVDSCVPWLTRAAKRPGVAQAMKLLKRGQAEGLVVARLDRVEPQASELATFIERLENHTFISADEPIDTRTSQGRREMVRLLRSAGTKQEWTISGHRLTELGERISTGIRQAKIDGATLGPSPLGWVRSNMLDEHGRRTVVRNEDEQAAIAQILSLRDKGYSLRAIAETLTLQGVPTKRGGKWAAYTVSKIIRRYLQSHHAPTPSPHRP